MVVRESHVCQGDFAWRLKEHLKVTVAVRIFRERITVRVAHGLHLHVYKHACNLQVTPSNLPDPVEKLPQALACVPKKKALRSPKLR